MRKAHLLTVIGILATAIVGCGGGAEESAKPAAPQAPAPVATAETPAPPPSETASAAPAPASTPELPASFVAAQSAESAQMNKFIDILKDEKATCGKLADSLAKFVNDPERDKTKKTFFDEWGKLTKEQRSEADKKSSHNEIEAKLNSMDPTVKKCKNDEKFSDALGKAFASFMPPKAGAAAGNTPAAGGGKPKK